MSVDRREFLRLLGGGGLALTMPGLFAACGDGGEEPASTSTSLPVAAAPSSARPQASSSEVIRIGFISLTDCASVVMAHELGLFKEYGLNVEVVKQASWASTRDNLLTGEIHAAHLLFGLPFSVYTGVGGQAGKEIQIAMVLNNNGQAITLSNEDFGGRVGFRTLDRVKSAVDAVAAKKEATFAMTFPGGTHDMWLRYWLGAAGVDQKAVKIITVPPPQMVANMKVNNMDGFSVGEPWGGVAVKEGTGFTAVTSQDIWKHHPEKVLGVNPSFAAQRRGDLKLLMRAILEASSYIDDGQHKAAVAKEIAKQSYVNAAPDVIDARLEGKYTLGKDLGEHVYAEDTMRFSNGGFVNLPRRAHAAWFMAEYVRHGYLKELPDVQAISQRLILGDLYREVAQEVSLAVPDDDMAPFELTLDGARFDPARPAVYLRDKGPGGVA